MRSCTYNLFIETGKQNKKTHQGAKNAVRHLILKLKINNMLCLCKCMQTVYAIIKVNENVFWCKLSMYN